MVLRANKERREEKARVRAALLRAALRLGEQHGFASLGLREVAREAGIAPTSFYRHFADMQEIGAALSSELVHEALAQVCSGLSRDPEHAATTLLDAMLAVTAQTPELMRFVVAERAGANPGLRAGLAVELASLSLALTKLDFQGGVPSTRAAADAAVAVVLDACALMLDQPEALGVTRRRSYARVIDGLLSLAPREGDARPERPRSPAAVTAAAKDEA